MRARLALTAALTGGLLLAATGTATAQEYGPEWQPGPDYTNFDPAPDQSGFDPQPDQSPFEPGYAPGTADIIDDPVGDLLQALFGGLFRR